MLSQCPTFRLQCNAAWSRDISQQPSVALFYLQLPDLPAPYFSSFSPALEVRVSLILHDGHQLPLSISNPPTVRLAASSRPPLNCEKRPLTIPSPPIGRSQNQLPVFCVASLHKVILTLFASDIWMTRCFAHWPSLKAR
jgi:hypothetical protein